MAQFAFDAAELAASLSIYWLRVIPVARRALRGWGDRARAIPDPVLRANATRSLRDKWLNVEANAAFATLAPRANRDKAIRAIVAFQVAADYLDILGEEPVDDPLRNGTQLHLAQADAVSPNASLSDHYRYHPQCDDGGYLKALVTVCRENVGPMPAFAAVQPLARKAAVRFGEGQSHIHTTTLQGTDRFAEWTGGLDAPTGYRWYEVAAGASSTIGVNALIAAAADPHTTQDDAAQIDAAYFPSNAAVTVLLDDMIDLASDRASDHHNFFSYYETNLIAADRLSAIWERADVLARGLRHGRRHTAILAGGVGFYLGTAEAATEYARPITTQLLSRTGPMVAPVQLMMRMRRRVRAGLHNDRARAGLTDHSG
jgi:tetraprenyl-beta-curcumene synthase